MKNKTLPAMSLGLCILAFIAAGCGNADDTNATADMLVAYDQEDLDSSWNAADSTLITLNGAQATIQGEGAAIKDDTLTITTEGTYVITGTSDNLKIQVDARDSLVRIVLNGANIQSTQDSVINVIDSRKTVLILAEGTINTLADSTTYTQEETDAAIFSTSDLTINGTGSLAIDSNYNDAIMTKDELKIVEGSITIDSVGDGLKGRDFVAVRGAILTITAASDGLQSTNEEATDKGFIAIEGGTLTLQAGGDGLAAATAVLISGGTFNIRTGTGSVAAKTDNQSLKGIKAGTELSISGGDFTIDSADDALHSNGGITIDAGRLAILSGDDGIHADSRITINGGTINISKSYEGIESASITINDGTITLISSDDGINIAGGADGSSQNGRPGQNTISADSEYYLEINGGTISVNSQGDGVDVNGNAVMNGGTLTVDGPSANDNAALDYDGSFLVYGGTILAGGSSGMAQAPGQSSKINSVSINFTSTLAAGTTVKITDSSGKEVFTYTGSKKFQSLAAAGEQLKQGETYTVKLVSGGSESTYTTFTPSGSVTTVGGAGPMGGGARP